MKSVFNSCKIKIKKKHHYPPNRKLMINVFNSFVRKEEKNKTFRTQYQIKKKSLPLPVFFSSFPV